MANIDEYRCDVQEDQRSAFQLSERVRRRVIFLLFEQHAAFKSAATDYRSRLFSSAEHKLTDAPHVAKQFTVIFYDEAQTMPAPQAVRSTYTVNVQFRQNLPIQPLKDYFQNSAAPFSKLEEYLNILNLMLSRCPNQSSDMVTAARGTKYCKIDRHNGRAALGGGLEVYPGYFRSARGSLSGLILNVNTAAATFFEEIRMDELIARWKLGFVPADEHKKGVELSRQFKGIRVRVSYDQVRAKTVHGIAIIEDHQQIPNADNVRFTRDKDPATGAPQSLTVTVNQHFSQAHPTAVRPNVDSLVLNVGSENRPVYIPSDLCHILPGQPDKHFIRHAEQTTNMINFACRRPELNKDMILQHGLPQLGIKQAGGPMNASILRCRHS